MKIVKYVFSICLVALAIYSCSQDDDGSNFVDGIKAPTNVSANVVITQDNTGLVTITPLGQGVSNFNIGFGDQSESVTGISPGSNIEHTYEEGTYEAIITGVSLNGLTTSITQTIVVSFQAPENLVVTIENDVAISRQVNVHAVADLAISYEVNFGDPANTVLTANNDETVSFIYDNTGIYTITVTAMSGAIETTTYSEDFEVTAILQPLASAPTPPSRAPGDVISFFSDSYTDIVGVDFNPDWGQATTYVPFDLAGDEMIQYANLNYQGIDFEGTPVNASQMEFLHVDIWTADDNNAKISPISSGPNETAYDLDLTSQQWTSFDIPLSFFTDQNPLVDFSDIIQFKFDGDPADGTIFVDNLYFYKAPTGPSTIVGTWKIAPEDGALSVGPGDGSLWWYLNQFGDDVTTRACYMDDRFVFNADGSFQNVLGSETWLEPWQGVDPEACGAPIAPHNGSNPATFIDDGSTITLNGLGAYLGLAKVHNSGEDGMPVGNTIDYDYTLSGDGNTLEVTISGFAGGAEVWYFKLIREGGDVVESPLVGTWQVAPEDGALSVGPGDGSLWWFLNQFGDDVATRACYMDDQYIFNADGSFQNVLGSETWLETWQGVAEDSCGTPIAPHDGSSPATFVDNGGTVTINGLGAFIGLAKVHNSGEDGMPAGNSTTYDYTLSGDGNTLEVTISGFAGGAEVWYYKLIKQ